MEKLTNEEIARVFAMYWGGKVSTIDGDGKMLTLYPKCITVKLNKITFGQELHGLDDGNGGLHRSYPHYGGSCKLYLTSLSKITDEHALDVAKINGIRTENPLLVGKSISYWLKIQGENRDCTIEIFQYLIQKGYAVPLFFGINHWANAKTPIELGIAIESL